MARVFAESILVVDCRTMSPATAIHVLANARRSAEKSHILALVDAANIDGIRQSSNYSRLSRIDTIAEMLLEQCEIETLAEAARQRELVGAGGES